MRTESDGAKKLVGRRMVSNSFFLWTALGMLAAASSLGLAATAQEVESEPYTVVFEPPYETSDSCVGAVANPQTGALALAKASYTPTCGWAWIATTHHLAEDAAFIDYEFEADRGLVGAGMYSARVVATAGGFGVASSDGILGPIVLSFRLEHPDGVISKGPITLRLEAKGGACQIVLFWCDPVEDTGAVVVGASLKSVTATVYPVSAAVDPSRIDLTAVGYKERGQHTVDLAWTNATGSSIDVIRDDVVIATTGNYGSFTDRMDQRGSAAYVYRVCEKGFGAMCSNEAVVGF